MHCTKVVCENKGLTYRLLHGMCKEELGRWEHCSVSGEKQEVEA